MTKNDPILILLVEDNPDHAEITVRVLEEDDNIRKIEVATDGQQALDYLYGNDKYSDRKKFPMPDLVLLDIKLPKVDGIEVLHDIKSDPVLKKIPVIILTTSDNDRDIAGAYEEGANSYISKPVSYKQFVAKVKDMGFYWADTNILPGTNE